MPIPPGPPQHHPHQGEGRGGHEGQQREPAVGGAHLEQGERPPSPPPPGGAPAARWGRAAPGRAATRSGRPSGPHGDADVAHEHRPPRRRTRAPAPSTSPISQPLSWAGVLDRVGQHHRLADRGLQGLLLVLGCTSGSPTRPAPAPGSAGWRPCRSRPRRSSGTRSPRRARRPPSPRRPLRRRGSSLPGRSRSPPGPARSPRRSGRRRPGSPGARPAQRTGASRPAAGYRPPAHRRRRRAPRVERAISPRRPVDGDGALGDPDRSVTSPSRALQRRSVAPSRPQIRASTAMLNATPSVPRDIPGTARDTPVAPRATGSRLTGEAGVLPRQRPGHCRRGHWPRRRARGPHGRGPTHPTPGRRHPGAGSRCPPRARRPRRELTQPAGELVGARVEVGGALGDLVVPCASDWHWRRPSGWRTRSG